MKKNVTGQKIGAQMVSATDGSVFTGSVTVAVTGDAGTQATGSVGSGACTHEGNGYHTYAPAQAETNYDLIAFTFTGSGGVPSTVQVFTDAATAAAAIQTKTDFLPSATAGAAGGLFIAGANAATSIATALTANIIGNITGVLSTLTTYTGNTPQTGDAYAALTGAQSEVAQGAPAANASPLVKLAWLFKAWRNKSTQDATTYKLYNDDAATVDSKATCSDDGTTFSRGEVATGP